jgi:nucleotide-binding universal stress UspA family protein
MVTSDLWLVAGGAHYREPINMMQCLIDSGSDPKMFPMLSAESDAHRRSATVYKNILIPTDGSDLAMKAVVHGVAFAKEIRAKITAVAVTEPFAVFALAPSQLEYSRAEYNKQAEAFAEQALAAVADAAKRARVECETVRIEREHVYEAIIDTAAANGCDLILMASHGRRGVSAIVLGSVTMKVLTHSKTPVLVYR